LERSPTPRSTITDTSIITLDTITIPHPPGTPRIQVTTPAVTAASTVDMADSTVDMADSMVEGSTAAAIDDV